MHKGTQHTKATKKKMRGKRNSHNVGKNNPWYGKHLPKKHREKIGKTRILKGLSKGKNNPMFGKKKFNGGEPPRGKKHWSWKGGITSLAVLIKGLPKYKQWRSDVFQRDNWTCQTCRAKNGNGEEIYLEAHHKKGLAKIIKESNITSIIEAQLCKELWDLDNGITLCVDCHRLTKNYGWRGR